MPGLGTVDLTDADLFRRNAFWPVLAWLRAHDPVHRHPEPDGDGFWVLSRYQDIVGVYANHDVFSSRFGMRLDSNPAAVEAVSQQMLIVTDPPHHTHLKRVLSKAFGPVELPRIEVLVRDVVHDAIRDAVHAAAQHEVIDFIDLAKRIPNQVVCSLMGIPRHDWEWIGAMTTEAFDSADPDERSAAHSEVFLYFADLLHQRRGGDGDDFVSRLARDRVRADEPPGERELSDEEIIFNCNGVLAGANETTRYAAAGGLLALMERPEQWDLLRAGGAAAVPGTVEEMLRWTTPGVHAMRTALQPARIAGVPIAAGDRVTLWNVSANRDESVFADPEVFDIRRSPNRHLTFGHGRHVCLGARMARLELAVFWEAFAEHVAAVEATGPAEFNDSNFTWGVRALPVRLHATPTTDGNGGLR
jgi:cytochrome P450